MKWLCCLAAWTICSEVASRRELNMLERRRTYSATAAAATAVSDRLYSAMTMNVPITRRPSMMPSTNCVVRLRWMVWIDPKRETMSPRWRFSK